MKRSYWHFCHLLLSVYDYLWIIVWVASSLMGFEISKTGRISFVSAVGSICIGIIFWFAASLAADYVVTTSNYPYMSNQQIFQKILRPSLESYMGEFEPSINLNIEKHHHYHTPLVTTTTTTT
jgi:hypothetical protein